MSNAILNGLPSSITQASPEETAAIEALALTPVNPHGEDRSTQILLGTPTLGMVSIHWYNAMQGLVMPPNWATVRSTPVGYSVADAQNMLVDACLKGPFKALLLIEDDTCPPPQALLEFDRWMWKMERKLAPPVVSGLYHLKGSAEVRKGVAFFAQLCEFSLRVFAKQLHSPHFIHLPRYRHHCILEFKLEQQ